MDDARVKSPFLKGTAQAFFATFLEKPFKSKNGIFRNHYNT